MSQTGKQELDEALASPEALQKLLGDWASRQRVRARIHAASALLFFISMGAALWFSFENPSKTGEATGAAIAFGLGGIFYALMALSSRKQSHAARKCKDALEVKDNTPI